MAHVTYTFELLNRQNLTSVVGKLSAEVRYLSSKNRLRCRFNGHFLAAQNMFCYLLRQKARTRSREHSANLGTKVGAQSKSFLRLSFVLTTAHSLADDRPAFDRPFKT
jgi:hypothetical protein